MVEVIEQAYQAKHQRYGIDTPILQPRYALYDPNPVEPEPKLVF